MITTFLTLTFIFLIFLWIVSWINYYNKLDNRLGSSIWRWSYDYPVLGKRDISVLDDKKFSDIVKKYNLVLMRGDLTKPNKDIMLYMKKFDRYGIPFNAIYSVDNSSGILLSELLTIKEIQHNLK